MLRAYAEGELPIEHLVSDFRNRHWGSPNRNVESLHHHADHERPENDWALVEAHRQAGHISPADYKKLVAAASRHRPVSEPVIPGGPRGDH